jgi:hypothetical protein
MRLLPLLLLVSPVPAQQGWWLTEPVRWVQTNLREPDAALDPQRLVEQTAAFHANVLHFSMGGIVAFYPSKLPYHNPSPQLPKQGDLLADLLRAAHARHIRVAGRFDFSKTVKRIYDEHPEWFFRTAAGQPVVYNGLYSTCINGGYYRGYAMRILEDALDRYDVDGLFFNMFGNQSTNYSGQFVGHCHCDSCRRKYRAMYGKDLPEQMDDQYREFLAACSREVAAEIGKLIHRKRPHAGYFNYMQQFTDGIMSESNTAVNRPLPLWPYSASDNVNRALNSEPSKLPVNLDMQFIDFPWRFATVPAGEIELRSWQNVAHGGALTLALNGTFDQQDRQAVERARPIFAWVAGHEQYYVGEKSAARVLLLGARGQNQSAYRGLFRLLTEEHIPFAVSDNLDWIGKRSFDLVLTAGQTPAGLRPYLEQGGSLLIATPQPPDFPVARIVRTWPNTQAYMRLRDRALFPSLALTSILMLQGDYTELESSASPALTFIPPSMFGPPEKVHIDMQDTSQPGLAVVKIGKGQVAWLPWDVAGMYYRYSLPAHAAVLRDLIDHLLQGKRQLRTNAHPLVEMSLMQQGNRRLLHLINLSGHADTAYFSPIPMRQIRVELAGDYHSAKALRAGESLALEHSPSTTSFTIPALEQYELVVLE